MSENRLKLLIFDWDGTLADSEFLIVNAMQSAIRELGMDRRNDGQIRNIIGLGLTEAATVLYPDLKAGDYVSLADSYRRNYSATAKGKTILFSDVREALNILQKQDYKMAIATGKSRRGLDNSLQETGIGDFFNITRCGDEAFSKPHPQMLFDIMDTLDIEPGNTLMIGDSEYDLQMATSAGVVSIAVSYGTQSKERLLLHNPVFCLDRLSQLVEWLSCIDRG